MNRPSIDVTSSIVDPLRLRSSIGLSMSRMLPCPALPAGRVAEPPAERCENAPLAAELPDGSSALCVDDRVEHVHVASFLPAG
jgi:hypothetical protein